jgi:hypothetical protein
VPEPLQTFWQGITITELLRLAGVTVSETTLPSLKTPSTVVLSGAASLKSTSQEQGHAPARHTGDTWRRKLRQRKLATKLTAPGGQPKPATRSLIKTKYLPRQAQAQAQVKNHKRKEAGPPRFSPNAIEEPAIPAKNATLF